MPKIGMTSSAMMMADWLVALKVAAAEKFDAFEICCVFPSADPDQITPDALAEAQKVVQKSGIEICVHAPFFEINIAAFSGGIREESIRLINKAVDLCHGLGGRTLVVHAGDFTYTFDGATRLNNPALAIQWQHNLESLKRINDYAQRKGVVVCLENIAINATSIDRNFEDLLEIRKAVGASLKFTLDTGHARLTEGTVRGIDLLGKQIRHIHLTDNFGEKDDHLPVGEGNDDFGSYIDFLRGFEHIITLEVVDIGTDPDPVLRCRRALQALFASQPAP
ncbi:MAG: sugar phosphate isomerase/epimerase [Deltaproteobacteria bacterium]|nr:sugar phosphate isomerase/epimerase [Deltaproteobacteria bacterium]